jgi:ParB-like chromosome segregation protein Spo0J
LRKGAITDTRDVISHHSGGVASERICEVDVKLLKLGVPVRFDCQDVDHARALALRFDDWPPILVDRDTSTVIDGVHRVLAARMLGRDMVAVRYFTGTPEQAFVEAVRANVTHGKPLTLAERESAARKLLTTHSDWSDRLVAHICGLSDKTVGRLRRTTAEIPQLSARVGRDGRQRPTDSRPLRNEIATALRARPDAKAAKLAQSLRTSPSTVRDVRKRIQMGEAPSPSDRRSVSYEGSRDRRGKNAPVDWRTDKAILALPAGDELAEWLDRSNIDSRHWEAVVAEIPIGRIPQLIEDARSRATEWTNFATSLEARFRALNRRA